MKKSLNEIYKLTIFLLSCFLLSTNLSSFVSASKDVTLYYSDNCEFCNTFETQIKEYVLDGSVNLIKKDVSEESIAIEFKSIATACNLDPNPPIIVINSQCFAANSNAVDLLSQANASIEQNNLITAFDSATSSPNQATTTQSTSTDATSTTTTTANNNATTLKLPQLQANNTSTTYTFIDYFFMILAPLAFIVIAYFIISRLKL